MCIRDRCVPRHHEPPTAFGCADGCRRLGAGSTHTITLRARSDEDLLVRVRPRNSVRPSRRCEALAIAQSLVSGSTTRMCTAGRQLRLAASRTPGPAGSGEREQEFQHEEEATDRAAATDPAPAPPYRRHRARPAWSQRTRRPRAGEGRRRPPRRGPAGDPFDVSFDVNSGGAGGIRTPGACALLFSRQPP